MLRRDLLAGGLAMGAAGLPGRRGAAQPAGQPAAASPPADIVEKKVFELRSHTTRGGAVIANLRVGYQSMGRLNAEGSNAILICHFFSADSHAFGRYEPNGPAGYWDNIIGPGKPIDTDRFFVLSSDTLANLNVPNPRTVTTGPANLNPSTGRPYGMDFPVVSMRDFIEVQKRLLDSLGVKRLAMVAGPSMGALQAVEWAAAYPQMIERVMPVVGGVVDPWLQAWLDIWEMPIRLDPNWRNGDYYGPGREAPLRGLAEALKIISLQARDRAWAGSLPRGAAPGEDPAHHMQGRFAVEKWLDDTALARARSADANSLLYLCRANQLFLNEYESPEAAIANGPGRWLVVPSPSDRVFLIETMNGFVESLRKAGKSVQRAELQGDFGHLNGVVNMPQVGEAVRAFLK